MTNVPRLIYWDSCVFLAYINEEPGRVDILDEILNEISDDKDDSIITSVESIVEASFGAVEKNLGVLDPDVERRIDSLWADRSVLTLVEVNEEIARIARNLLRDAIPNNWALKPKDAIHLATAQWVDRNASPVSEFHTYDTKLEKYQTMMGIHIVEPYVVQHRMSI